MLWTIVSSIAFGLAGLVIYIYYFQKGQFEDPEDVKYQIFREEEITPSATRVPAEQDTSAAASNDR